MTMEDKEASLAIIAVMGIINLLLKFPRFQRSDIDGWILKCDKYFELDSAPQERKITMASLELDEKAYLWHAPFMEGEHIQELRWAEYKQALRIRFGQPCESPIGDLKKLKHKDSLEDYSGEIDILRHKLHLSESHVVQAYIEELR